MARKKNTTVFLCEECGDEFPRWSGKCESCGAWNSLKEFTPPSAPAGGKGASRGSGAGGAPFKLDTLPALSDIPLDEASRGKTGIAEFDMVLGGGLVPGSFILLGGEPGVGKSTLILEIARLFPGTIYYFSGEESASQVKMRSKRMGVESKDLYISRETDLDAVCYRVAREKPALAVIDSIQTVHRSGGSAPGSPAGLKEAALALMETCKESRVPILVTGHITRDGGIAGPKMMEHMVDVVLYFESDRLGHYRLLRAVKNRFGPVGEVAIFEMHAGGLREPGSLEIVESPGAAVGPGRVYSVMLEGSRAIGVEVQALVSRTPYGQTRRMAEGLDSRRLILMSAVMEKYLKINLAEYDIFANLAGGLTANEPALDLALCGAILSSYREEPAPAGTAFLGEVGLSGEVRPVGRVMARIKELTNLGFKTFFVPEANRKEIQPMDADIRLVEHVTDLTPAAQAPPSGGAGRSR